MAAEIRQQPGVIEKTLKAEWRNAEAARAFCAASGEADRVGGAGNVRQRGTIRTLFIRDLDWDTGVFGSAVSVYVVRR